MGVGTALDFAPDIDRDLGLSAAAALASADAFSVAPRAGVLPILRALHSGLGDRMMLDETSVSYM